MDIHWDTFTWGDFATLFTGVAAVGAAIYVGRRQVGIAATQAQIQRDQTDIQGELLRLEEIKLKADLYDQRLAIFNATSDYADYLTSKGHAPGFHEDEGGKTLGWDVNLAFSKARGAAEFLSSENVRNVLSRLWAMGSDLLVNEANLENAKDEGDLAAKGEALKKKADLRNEAFLINQKLRETFAEDLRLTVRSKDQPSG